MKKLALVFFVILRSLPWLIGQEISPYLFGQNFWMEKNTERNRPGYINILWPKVEASGIKMVRIGGIGYENNFPSKDKLAAMVDSIRAIGAEPLVQVPRDISEEHVSKLISDFKYINGKGIHFYSIGNEPICNGKGTIDDVYEYILRLAPSMKAVDPSIKILVFDACTFYGEAYAALCGGRLDITGKDKNGNWMIDGFTFHNYPNGREYNRDNVIFSGPRSIASQAVLLVEMMGKANKKHGREDDSKLLWGLTEVNVTYANPNREIAGYGNPSFLAGQFMAAIYGIGMKHGALTIAPWCISETDRVRTDFGYLGMPSEFYPRSSYYHTQMMALNMEGEFLQTESNNSYVKTIGTQSDAVICIMILNSDNAHDFEFDLILNKKGDSGKALVVRADLGLDQTISGSISNQSTIMFVLSKSGQILKHYLYGLEHNLKYLPPELINNLSNNENK